MFVRKFACHAALDLYVNKGKTKLFFQETEFERYFGDRQLLFDRRDIKKDTANP